jgi:hypothetical protein
MKTLFLSLMLISIPSMAEAHEISLDIQYSRYGEEICHERLTVTTGEGYTLCEKSFRGKTNMLSISTRVEEETQVKVTILRQELEPSGSVKVLGVSSIMINDGKRAELTQASEEDGKYVESENIAVIPNIER